MADRPCKMESLVMPGSYFSYYRDKRVFITGHTGFKGSWLLLALHEAGAIIKGYALEPEYEGLYNLVEPLNFAESVIADIRDKNKLKQEIISFQPDFIFHLAAQPLVRRSYEIPAETFEINVVGTAHLFEAICDLEKQCCVIIITTDKVYENKELDVYYKEEDRLGGYDPYSASKACTEIVVSSFRNSFFNANHFAIHKKAIATARAGNVIGGGDRSKDRIIPDIIRSLEAGQPVAVRNPQAVRPWQHVLEPLSGYLKLGALLDRDPQRYSCSYNFGPLANDHLSVQELVMKAIEIWGNGNWKDDSRPGQVHEANLLKLDIGLAQKELDWRPKLSAAESIQWAISWYKKPVAEQLAYSIEQINTYFS